MSVRIISDSTAALDPATAAEFGITIVPTVVTLGGVSYRDGELPLQELVDRFDEGVSTAGPPPAAFSSVLDGAQDGAVILTVASGLSSVYRAATVGTRELDADVRLVDTGTSAGALALVALHAAKVAAAGASVDEVEAAAREVADKARLYGAMRTLEYLIKGGRVNGIVGGLADRLGVQPLFELRRGRIGRLRPAFSRRGALRRLLKLWRKSRIDGARLHVIALHALARDEAESLLEQVCAEVEPETALIAEFGAVMVAHTGPGLIGLSWWWEEG
jgi:DegV family protein with EDD domain